MKPRKIVAIEFAGKWGLCHYTYGFCNGLAAAGHEVVLVTAKDYETAELPKSFAVWPVFRMLRTNPVDMLRLLARLALMRPDVVHFQTADHPFLDLVWVMLIKLMTGAKVVHTAHNILPRLKGQKPGRVLNALYHQFDLIFVHHANNKVELVRRFGLPQDKVVAIPFGNFNFLADEAVMPPAPEALVPEWDGPSVLFFGLIVESKGLDYLIRAFGRVRKVIPDARLLIVGHPQIDFAPYVKDIQREHLGSHVFLRLEGVPLEEIPAYFQSCDMVAAPYRRSYLFQSAVVQLAHGFSKPVVGTNTGGLSELVRHGDTGILVPPEDEESLANAIIELLEDKERRQQMGTQARRFAETEHSWDKVAHLTSVAYESLFRNPANLQQNVKEEGEI
jgi:glycosyltransferase involved in cell wall biosynthesis